MIYIHFPKSKLKSQVSSKFKVFHSCGENKPLFIKNKWTPNLIRVKMVIQLSGHYGENNDAQMKCKRENKI
jgi:hypothetical protein